MAEEHGWLVQLPHKEKVGGSSPPSATINSFSGDYRFLSNFWPCKVVFDGVTYPSVEHAYVAAKTPDPILRMQIASIETAGQVKKFGRKLELRPDWDSVKVGIMRDLIRQKFKDAELAALLVATGDALLVEGNWWGDTFWGVCKGVGDNWLGRILMEVRSEINRRPPDS